MALAKSTVDLVGLIASATAAWLWWRACRVEVPPFPDVGLGSGSWVFEPVRKAIARSAQLNARAALASALAAFCAAVGFCLGI